MHSPANAIELSLYKDLLIDLDIMEPDTAACQELENLSYGIIVAGDIEGLKKANIEAQKLWGTLPESHSGRKPVRFLPGINPLSRLIGNNEVSILKGLNKNYFGFTAAGLALDVPEKMFGKREGYRHSVTLEQALDAHASGFGIFRCKTRAEVGAYLQLLKDDLCTRYNAWDFVERGDVDFTRYHIWGNADKINVYSARRGLLKASAITEAWVEGDCLPHGDLSDREKANRNILLSVLSGPDSASILCEIGNMHQKSTGALFGITVVLERLAREVFGIDEKAKSKLIDKIGKAYFSINLGRNELEEKIFREVVEWLGVDRLKRIHSADRLKILYDVTNSPILLPFASDKARESHLGADLGL